MLQPHMLARASLTAWSGWEWVVFAHFTDQETEAQCREGSSPQVTPSARSFSLPSRAPASQESPWCVLQAGRPGLWKALVLSLVTLCPPGKAGDVCREHLLNPGGISPLPEVRPVLSPEVALQRSLCGPTHSPRLCAVLRRGMATGPCGLSSWGFTSQNALRLEAADLLLHVQVTPSVAVPSGASEVSRDAARSPSPAARAGGPPGRGSGDALRTPSSHWPGCPWGRDSRGCCVARHLAPLPGDGRCPGDGRAHVDGRASTSALPAPLPLHHCNPSRGWPSICLRQGRQQGFYFHIENHCLSWEEEEQ